MCACGSLSQAGARPSPKSVAQALPAPWATEPHSLSEAGGMAASPEKVPTLAGEVPDPRATRPDQPGGGSTFPSRDGLIPVSVKGRGCHPPHASPAPRSGLGRDEHRTRGRSTPGYPGRSFSSTCSQPEQVLLEGNHGSSSTRVRPYQAAL
jgi:hypothetical protein